MAAIAATGMTQRQSFCRRRTSQLGYSALALAASSGHVGATRLLLDHGANPDARNQVSPMRPLSSY